MMSFVLVVFCSFYATVITSFTQTTVMMSFFFHKCSFFPCFPMYSSPLPRARTICSDAPSFTRWGRNWRLSMLRASTASSDRGGQCYCSHNFSVEAV